MGIGCLMRGCCNGLLIKLSREENVAVFLCVFLACLPRIFVCANEIGVVWNLYKICLFAMRVNILRVCWYSIINKIDMDFRNDK